MNQGLRLDLNLQNRRREEEAYKDLLRCMGKQYLELHFGSYQESNRERTQVSQPADNLKLLHTVISFEAKEDDMTARGCFDEHTCVNARSLLEQ